MRRQKGGTSLCFDSSDWTALQVFMFLCYYHRRRRRVYEEAPSSDARSSADGSPLPDGAWYPRRATRFHADWGATSPFLMPRPKLVSQPDRRWAARVSLTTWSLGGVPLTTCRCQFFRGGSSITTSRSLRHCEEGIFGSECSGECRS